MGSRRKGFTSVVALVAIFGLAGCAGGAGDGLGAKGAKTSEALGSASSTTATGEPSPSPSKTKSTAQAVKIPRCATKVSSAKDGYHVALPCGYSRIKDVSSLAKKTRALLKQRNINVSDAMLKNFTLYAMDLSSGSSVNLLIAPAPGATTMSLIGLRSAARKQLTAVGGKNLKFSTVTVAGDAALRVTLQVSLAGQTVQEIQVYTVHDEKVFIWTFADKKRPKAAEKFVMGTFGYL